MEFMAIGALRCDVHTFRHDLETFFYVFLLVCIKALETGLGYLV